MMNDAFARLRLSEWLRDARARRASDVHVAAGASPVARIDGELTPLASSTVNADQCAALVPVVLSGYAQRRFDREKHVTVTASLEEQGRVRAHVYSSQGRPAFAFRLLPEQPPRLETLHLPDAVTALCDRTSGLVLFAGPTGSGKSTALAALVERINERCSRHIFTIEDPTEFTYVSKRSRITQCELGRDVKSYQSAVRGALRSDPDVMLVGEMRDAQTIRAAIASAETGHLVFSTLHTRDATQTVDRIVCSFAPAAQTHARVQLAQTLAAVVCLRLVPRTDGGRIAAAEVLVATDAVRAMIREGRTHHLRTAIETGRDQQMQTLECDLERLVQTGEITRSAARAASARVAAVPDASF